MFGSIYIGMSGLDAYARGLQQVSNNVSNLNSQGFKSSTVTFRDLFGPSGQGQEFGTENGAGHGVMNGQTLLDLKQGELRQTERDLDLAVDGNGFLMLMRGDEVAYTRTGSFEIDDKGFVILSGSDYQLAVRGEDGQPHSVTVDPSRTSAPQATTRIDLADNLEPSLLTTYSLNNVKVIDPAGGTHVWTLNFDRITSVSGQWTLSIKDDKTNDVGSKTFSFSGGLIDSSTQSLSFTEPTTSAVINIDLSKLTSFSGPGSTVRAASVDGYASGTLVTVAVNEKGELELAYSNEQKKQLGAIELATFDDPQALVQKSGGLFLDPGGARRTLLTSEDPRAGTVLSRRIEASNVDLSREFGDLILIQRGFQASSQIVSVTNDMIQQLFGIRGQN